MALLPKRGELIEALERLFALDHFVCEFHRWGVPLFSSRRFIGNVFWPDIALRSRGRHFCGCRRLSGDLRLRLFERAAFPSFAGLRIAVW